MIEVELKFSIQLPETLESVRRRFVASGAVAHQVSVQSDEYLNDPLRDFAKQDKALRIRMESAACAEQLKQAFLGIGFVSVAKVSKRRETLTISWEGESIEICLDEVDEVGSFVEVELVLEDDGDIESAKQTLLSLAKNVGLPEPIKTSYLELLLERRGLL